MLLYIVHKLVLIKTELGIVDAIVSALAGTKHHNDMVVVA